MGIPPHAARLAGAWAVKSAAAQQSMLESGLVSDLPAGPEPTPAPSPWPQRDRSHRLAVSRILHPLHRHA
jgi:hypothetical protein